jgi:peptidoglycan hydrolase CwlO-like protein
MPDKSFTKNVMLLGAILTVVVGTLSAWGTYGWVTRTAYAQDHEGASVKTQQQAILKSLDALTLAVGVVREEQDKNQDQWECDETDEELKEYLNKADTTGLTSSEKREQTKLEEVWIDKRCTRFTD